MADTINYEDFNISVRGWAMDVRRVMVANARSEKPGMKKRLPKTGKRLYRPNPFLWVSGKATVR